MPSHISINALADHSSIGSTVRKGAVAKLKVHQIQRAPAAFRLISWIFETDKRRRLQTLPAIFASKASETERRCRAKENVDAVTNTRLDFSSNPKYLSADPVSCSNSAIAARNWTRR